MEISTPDGKTIRLFHCCMINKNGRIIDNHFSYLLAEMRGSTYNAMVNDPKDDPKSNLNVLLVTFSLFFNLQLVVFCVVFQSPNSIIDFFIYYEPDFGIIGHYLCNEIVK